MADGDGQNGDQPGSGAAPPAEGSAGGGQPSPSPPARPEGVPEKFWDAAAGALRTDALLKSYTELEKGWGKARETALSEAQAKLREGVPEKADGYDLKPAK